MLSVCKVFRFEAAHSLPNHPGACKNLHGHSYELDVCVNAKTLNDQGMVMDFGDLKRIVQREIIDEFDHSVVLKKESLLALTLMHSDQKLVLLDNDPTAENMVGLFANRLMSALPEGIHVHFLKLWETSTSYALWENDRD